MTATRGAVTGIALNRGGHRAPASRLEHQIHRELRQYFDGERTEFTFPVRLEGSEFDVVVWNALREIPYGETRTYGDIARRIGRPTAARAVGAANGRNPVPIVVPCHRVVAAGGKLGGFGGGLELKRRLLLLEGARSVPLESGE